MAQHQGSYNYALSAAAAPCFADGRDHGSRNSNQCINDTPSPSPSSFPASPLSFISVPPGYDIVNDPFLLSSINNCVSPLTMSDHILELESLQERPAFLHDVSRCQYISKQIATRQIAGQLDIHSNTTQISPCQIPSSSSFELTHDDDLRQPSCMSDIDQDSVGNILASLPFDGLQCLYDTEWYYSTFDDICSPAHATSAVLPCQPTVSNILHDNFTIPQTPADFGHDAPASCFNLVEDLVSCIPEWSSSVASHVGKEGADAEGMAPHQYHRHDGHGAPHTVTISVQTEKPSLLADGYVWRKYGQKKIKSKRDHQPRAYFRCAKKGCPVRKQVDLSSGRGGLCIFTYKERHNHHPP